MRQNFFQAIGLVDMERVHSSFLGWILSEDCYAFDQETKSQLLCNIFGAKYDEQFSIINVLVESHNFDILVLTEDDSLRKTYWIIENKVKSSQHNNQLNKYVDDLVKLANSNEKRFCLLSLISEEPLSKKVKWHCTTYGQLANYIENALKQANNSVDDYIFVKAYIECIKSLDAALQDFIANHLDYPNVFTNGSKRKDNKPIGNAKGKHVQFIEKNNLETIFQKAFLKILAERMSQWKQKDYTVSETRGIALIDYLDYMKWEEQGLESHIQIQNGSFKVFLGEIIGKEENKVSFLNVWNDFFMSLEKKHGGWQTNKPRSKPSISISKHDKVWYTKSTEELIKTWNNIYKESKAIQDEIKDKINDIFGRS